MIELLNLSQKALMIHLEILNRYKYSIKNNFKDENGIICIIYTIEQFMKKFKLSKPTVIKYLKELENKGYITKKRRGRGKSNLIYINQKEGLENKLSKLGKNILSNSKKTKSENKSLNKYNKSTANKTNNKNQNYKDIQKKEMIKLIDAPKSKLTNITNSIKKHNSHIPFKKNTNFLLNKNSKNIKYTINYKEKFINTHIEKLKKNIKYDELKAMSVFKENTMLESYIDIIKNSLYHNTIKVNKCFINIDKFIDKILCLDKNHILYVYECISNVKNKILNIPAYILTCMFNATTTYNIYSFNKNKYNNYDLIDNKNSKRKSYLNTPTLIGQELEDALLSNNDLDLF